MIYDVYGDVDGVETLLSIVELRQLREIFIDYSHTTYKPYDDCNEADPDEWCFVFIVDGDCDQLREKLTWLKMSSGRFGIKAYDDLESFAERVGFDLEKTLCYVI